MVVLVCIAPDKEKGSAVELEAVMARVEGEESMGEGIMRVGVMVYVTSMGLVEEDWMERLRLLVKLSGAMRESENGVGGWVEEGTGGYWSSQSGAECFIVGC